MHARMAELFGCLLVHLDDEEAVGAAAGGVHLCGGRRPMLEACERWGRSSEESPQTTEKEFDALRRPAEP